MKGTLQVYENFGTPNQKLVLEESNLVVDSAAEIITDMLTTPSTLGVAATLTGNLLDASNYRVNALSFGKAHSQYTNNSHRFSPPVRNFLSDSNNFTASGHDVVEWNRNLLSRNWSPLSGSPSAAGYFVESSGGWTSNLSTSAFLSGAPSPVGVFIGNTLYSMSAPLAYAQRNIIVEGNNTAEYLRSASSLTAFPSWTLQGVAAFPEVSSDYMGANNARGINITTSSKSFAQGNKLRSYAQYWDADSAGIRDGSGYILSGIQPEVNTDVDYSWSVYYKVSSIPGGIGPDDPTAPPVDVTSQLMSTISLQFFASSFSIPSENFNMWNTVYGNDTNDFQSFSVNNVTRTVNASTGPDAAPNSTGLDATSNGGYAHIDHVRGCTAFSPLGCYMNEGRFWAQQIYIKKSLADPPTSPTKIEVYNRAIGGNVGAGAGIFLDWDGVSEGTSSLDFYNTVAPDTHATSGLEGYVVVEKATNGFYRVVIVVPIQTPNATEATNRYRLNIYPGGKAGQGTVYVNNYQIFEIPTEQRRDPPEVVNTLMVSPFGSKFRTDIILKNGVEVFPSTLGGTGHPYDDSDGEIDMWRRAEHNTTFSSTPHLFAPKIFFGYAAVGDTYQICNPQLEGNAAASIWTDSSTVTIHKGIADDGLTLIESSAIPMMNSGGTLDKELTFSMYANPSGMHAPVGGMSLRLIGSENNSSNYARTLTALTPADTSYVRGNHKITFTGKERTDIGAAVYVSGVSSTDYVNLANAQIEYDGTRFLPEDTTLNPHGQTTPTPWVSSVGTSTIGSWGGAGVKVDDVSLQVSTAHPNIIEGPFAGTSGTLILNNSEVSTLTLQQRIIGQNASIGVTTYSTTPFYDKKLTASIYIKYPFENPPGVIPEASGVTTGLARRSEVALYPGIATGDIARINTESGYENGGRVIVRWTDADGVQSPGAGSAVIDNDVLDGTAADGTLEYVNNGWYRVSVTNKSHAYTYANTSSVVFSVYPVARMYTDLYGSPNTASGGLYVYGAQLELGDHPTGFVDSSTLYSITPGPFVSFSGEYPVNSQERNDLDWSSTFTTSTIYAQQPYHITNPSGVNLVKDNLEFVSENWVSSNINVTNLGDPAQTPPDTTVAPILFVPGFGESFLRQDITSSALVDGKTYVLSLFLKREGNTRPPAGIEFITQMFSPGGDRMAAMGFDWNTSTVSAAPMVGSSDRVGTFALHKLSDDYGTPAFRWFRFYLTYPYTKDDGNGDIRIKLYPFGSNLGLKNKYGGYIAKALLQPADTSSYIPPGFLPKYPQPQDTTLVEDYTLPMASAMDLSTTFNQNLNFIAFRDSSTLSVSSFKDVEIVPHHNPNSSDTENDLSGAFGLNAYYYGCFPDGSATPNAVAIVSSLYTSEAMSNPVASGTFGGYFNQCSAMDPSGFLRVWPDQGSEVNNSLYLTSGVVTSSNLDFSNTGEVIYISKIASGDLGMANMYGGISQIGLWGVDIKRMIKEGRLPPYPFLPSAGSPRPIGNDLAYKMICKKVLNRNLTTIFDSSGPGLTNYRDLTLVWRLKFL